MAGTELLGGADPTGLPDAAASQIVRVQDGATFDLSVAPVAKRIGETTFWMLAYNGSIPGPTLRVVQGSSINVRVRNGTDIETTVHWHGLRLENPYDGVPHETQSPIESGGEYTHRLTFPDAGLFWYHPHMREDFAQEMGLYGNVLVDPANDGYWGPVDREVVLTLDDILVEHGAITPFEAHDSNFTAMGRFGNVLLIGGETAQSLEVGRGEVVRFLLTNTANTRVFRVALPGARMKLVGGDAGRYERESWVEDVVIAPSERAIVEVLFDEPGSLSLQHLTPARTYALVHISVAEEEVESRASDFETLRLDDEMCAERERIAPYLDVPPHKILALVAEMHLDEPEGAGSYACPMHPEVVSDEPGKCPKCGMKLVARPASKVYACPMHPEVVSDEPGKCPKCGMKLIASSTSSDVQEPAHQHHHEEGMADGIEWEDMMFEVNRGTNPRNMQWRIVDLDSGLVNEQIDWRFRLGDRVKIRIVNEMESDHPMHHPFHVHGERFLILSRDGVGEANLVWKDTVLVRTGEVVEILLDVSNPGRWMAHCHIAEHMEGGMMFSFSVER